MKVHPHLVLANGIDTHHFQTLHNFEFLVPARITRPGPYSVRNEMLGRPRSALLRALTGTGKSPVEAEFQTFGANMAWLDVQVKDTLFSILFNQHLRPGGRTDNYMVFFVYRPYAIAVARLVTLMPLLFHDDQRILEGVDFAPGYVEEDVGIRELHQVVNRLLEAGLAEER